MVLNILLLHCSKNVPNMLRTLSIMIKVSSSTVVLGGRLCCVLLALQTRG